MLFILAPLLFVKQKYLNNLKLSTYYYIHVCSEVNKLGHTIYQENKYTILTDMKLSTTELLPVLKYTFLSALPRCTQTYVRI